ncbi:DUF2427 domain-containing protein [Kocuria palustris]|nr:DUF2427 domain-containing protein [Kocuria palustris]
MKFVAIASLATIPLAVATALEPRHEGHDEDAMDMAGAPAATQSPATATDDHAMNMNMTQPTPHLMHHAHGVPILDTKLDPLERQWWENYDTETYFNAPLNHRAALWVHVIVGLLSFIFIYPIALVLKNVGLAWYMPVLTVHTAAVLLLLFNYLIFINLVPDLYPGNKYGTMLWVLFFTTVAQYVAATVYYGTQYLTGANSDYARVDQYFDIEEGEPLRDLSDRELTLLRPDELSSLLLFELTEQQMKVFNGPSRNPFAKVYKLPMFQRVLNSLYIVSLIVFNILNWGNFAFFLALVPTAIAVLGEFGKGKAVFNMLAHFIKGGIFFTYGLVTLARYMGAFSNKGWAWNHKFIRRVGLKADERQPTGTFSMEFVELLLISIYGCSNIFLEHLAGAGGAWTSKDLQHALIAFIYIGCGFGGLICEAKLSKWRRERATTDARAYAIANPDMADVAELDAHAVKALPGYSPNPFPVLTIFWTGVLMLKHAQALSLSTEIHTLWGNLFLYGCFFRGALYLLMMLMPKNTSLTTPTRPFTEVILSFCLLLGGAIFMELTDPIIYAFEWHGWTTMFILNVSLGLVTLLMAWEMAVFAFKDWMIKRMAKR